MTQILKHDQEVDLKVKSKAEVWCTVEEIFRVEKASILCPLVIILRAIVNEIAKENQDYDSITNTYGYSHDLLLSVMIYRVSYSDLVKVLDYTEWIDNYSYYDDDQIVHNLSAFNIPASCLHQLITKKVQTQMSLI
jgi:hypothetical protein